MKEAEVTLCGHGSGAPRITSAAKYNSYRYSKIVNKGGKTWRKGVICVLRPKGMTDTLRKAYHDKYKTILGRNHYSQDKRGYCYIPYDDGKYYSDCSSSQCLTLKAIGLPIPNYNTEGMYDSSAFTRLDIKIEKGHIVEPEKLKVGDQILYAGANPDRAKRDYVGHVEGVYDISWNGCTETVLKYQKFLNENYAQLLKSYCGGLLAEDDDYGKKTRNASVCVWKYMVVKYYGAPLTVGNNNFYSLSQKWAEDITNAEIKKHPTFGYILNGILAGRGYTTTLSGTFTESTRLALIAFQKDHSIPQTGRMDGSAWYALFN